MTDPVRAVDRALEILLSFTQEQPVLSLTEIAEKVGMSKSTVHRLLGTLESKRFLVRSSTSGKYHLGLRLLEMASQALDDVRQQWALPYLQRLAQMTGETVDLAVLDGDHVIYLQVVESRQRVKIAAAIGQRLPATCTASGKAFLAHLPEERVRLLLAGGIARHTDRTRTDLQDLLMDLHETRLRGFAMSQGEFEEDISAIAAPILGADGFPIASIAVVGPTYRMPPERMPDLGRCLQEVIASIRYEVGLTALAAMLPRDLAWQ